MPDKLKELLTSKKVLTALTGIVIAVAAKKGLNLDPELTLAVVGIIIALLFGQGLNDMGKAAAQIQAESPAPPAAVVEQTVNVSDEDKKVTAPLGGE